jgi:hypothetical protein
VCEVQNPMSRAYQAAKVIQGHQRKVQKYTRKGQYETKSCRQHKQNDIHCCCCFLFYHDCEFRFLSVGGALCPSRLLEVTKLQEGALY